MKKVLSIMFVFVMILGLSVPVAAETYQAVGGKEHPVKVNVDALDESGTKYAFTIEWDDLIFDYNAGQQGVWDYQSHNYAATTGAGWTDAENTVTIANHSNVKIKYTAAYANTDNHYADKITLTPVGEPPEGQAITGSGIEIDAPTLGSDYATAPKQAFDVRINTAGGFAPAHDANQVTIGTLTVTISAVSGS